MGSTLLPTDQVEVLVQSGLPDSALDIYVNGADYDIIRVAGPHEGTVRHVIRPDYSIYVYLPRPAVTIDSVREWYDYGDEAGATVVPASQYEVLGNGRSIRRKQARWADNVAVTYIPEDDRAVRVGVLVDLVKWHLAQSGHNRRRRGSLEEEPRTEADRRRILARLVNWRSLVR